MVSVIKVAPGDTILITIGDEVDLDEYRVISEKLINLLNTPNVVLMPEYAVKDVTVFKRELTGTSNMFLDGEVIFMTNATNTISMDNRRQYTYADTNKASISGGVIGEYTGYPFQVVNIQPNDVILLKIADNLSLR